MRHNFFCLLFPIAVLSIENASKGRYRLPIFTFLSYRVILKRCLTPMAIFGRRRKRIKKRKKERESERWRVHIIEKNAKPLKGTANEEMGI